MCSFGRALSTRHGERPEGRAPVGDLTGSDGVAQVGFRSVRGDTGREDLHGRSQSKGRCPLIHGDFAQYSEDEARDQFHLENKKLLKVSLQQGPVMAKLGAMVAYQGEAAFKNLGSGGLKKMLKKAMTNEGVSSMEMSGTGQVFLANQGMDIQVMYLENDTVYCNGASVLAYSASVDADIERVGSGGGGIGAMAGAMAGGFYQVRLTGTGYVAVTSDGQPVVLDVTQAQTVADADAVVLWSGGVSMQPRVDTGGLKSMVRGGTGEMLQLAFGGQGWVMVQPSEGVVQGTGQQQSQGGGGLSGLLGG